MAVPLTIARLNKGRLNAFRLNWIGADVTPPTAPPTLTATAVGGHRVDLSWGAATDNYGVAGYVVERCTGAGCTSWAFAGSTSGTGTTFSDTTANPSTTYRYRVRAGDASGNYGPYSPIATTTTADLVNISIKVGGTWTSINPYARVAGASITQALNEVADTLTLRIDGACPYALKGIEIQWVNSENVLQFAGHITAVRTTYEGRAKNRVYECDCIDYTWLLNSKKVTARYTNQTTAGIISSLMTSFGPAGYTVDTSQLTNNVTLDEITFTNEELSQAISRTCERGGAYWYADYSKVVRAFNSAAIPSAGTIDQANPRQSSKLAKHEDYVPVATRIFARGGGAGATSDCAPGQTTLPIDDASWYNTSGGTVESGPQRISYTGVGGASESGSTTGKIQPPPANANYFSPGGAGTGTFAAGQYYCAATNATTEGETMLGPLTRITNPAGSNIMIGITAANIPTDPRIKGFRVYIGTTNGGPETMKMHDYTRVVTNQYGLNWNEGSGYYLVAGPGDLTATLPPTTNSAGNATTAVAPGASSIPVDDVAQFAASGWVEAPGGQLLRYTGKSAASGTGSLTGIPPSGIGSVTATIGAGTIKSIPHLTGIPASGAGSITVPIKSGDQVLIFIGTSDSAAIAALAAATGGDGIRDEFLTDGRLGIAELSARAQALLTMRKDPLVTVTFETHDAAVSVGKTITFNTTDPPIVGTFLIQRVVISDFQAKGSIAHPLARRVVEASSRRYTFDDLVQQIKLLGRIN